jgi:nitrate reductase NapE component
MKTDFWLKVAILIYIVFTVVSVTMLGKYVFYY